MKKCKRCGVEREDGYFEYDSGDCGCGERAKHDAADGTTVGELIDQLKQLPTDAKVYTWDDYFFDSVDGARMETDDDREQFVDDMKIGPGGAGDPDPLRKRGGRVVIR